MSTVLPRFGNIVWVEIFDPQGRNPKVRPAVVITPTQEINIDGTIVVIGITSQTNEATPEVTVPIPWQRNQHPRTKLSKPSVAVCTWKVSVPTIAVQEIKGQVPLPELSQILKIVTLLDQPDNTELG